MKKEAQLFKEFLIVNDLLDMFEFNFSKSKDYKELSVNEFVEMEYPETYLIRSFSWSATPEGCAFWEKINSLWMESLIYGKLKIDNDISDLIEINTENLKESLSELKSNIQEALNYFNPQSISSVEKMPENAIKHLEYANEKLTKIIHQLGD